MKRLSRYAWLVLACLLFVAIAPTASAQIREANLWWMPEVVTKGGKRIDSLFYIIFWLTTAVFILVQTTFIWFVVKYRRKRGVSAEYSHGNNKLEVVWTTLPAEADDAAAVLALYRVRWQIELAFKRMKSLMGLGQLPKKSDASSRAWLHGKLLLALLVERLLGLALLRSPDSESRQILLTHKLLVHRHRDQYLLIAGIDDDVQAITICRKFGCFHGSLPNGVANFRSTQARMQSRIACRCVT